MTDIKQGEVVTRIYEMYKKRGDAEKPRDYLGASSIGDECNRKLWYGFRWATRNNQEGRMYRLFGTGHYAEPRFYMDLRDIGVKVYERDPKTGLQLAYSDIYGHFRGHLDGIVTDVPDGGAKRHVLECKTHNAKSFAQLVKHGVELSKPMHFAQTQTYMGWDGSERALYIAVNKDTDELYAERIRYDAPTFYRLQAKAEKIVFSPLPPPRLSDDPEFFLCKMCDHSAVCHGKRVPRKSCRTCVHATPTRDGNATWHCSRYDINPTHDQQLTGCQSHLPLPPLVQYADPEDAGEDWILMRHKTTARQFVIGTMPPSELIELPLYSSAEIAAVDGAFVTDEFVDDMKKLGAKIK